MGKNSKGILWTFVDILQTFHGAGDQGSEICVLYQRMGRVVVANENVLGSVRPEFDRSCIE